MTLSGNTRHAKCVDCILSSGIENVDVYLCAERSMLFFMPLLARPYYCCMHESKQVTGGVLTCGISFAMPRLTVYRSRLCDNSLWTLAKLIGSKALSLSSHQGNWDVIVIIYSQVACFPALGSESRLLNICIYIYIHIYIIYIHNDVYNIDRMYPSLFESSYFLFSKSESTPSASLFHE